MDAFCRIRYDSRVRRNTASDRRMTRTYASDPNPNPNPKANPHPTLTQTPTL